MRNYWKLRLSNTVFIIFFCFFYPAVSAQENPYLFPIRPGQQNYLSGTMGEMRGAHFHGGMDIKTGGVTGYKVYAAADGYVSRLKVEGGGYGNALYLEHPHLGTTTVYGHLLSFNDEMGEYVLIEQYKRKSFAVDLYLDNTLYKVKKGDFIGLSGNSGSSGGPHLHFEIRDNQQRPMNPLNYGFSEIKDNIAPTIQKIGLKTLTKDSRIDQQFGFFEFTPSRLGDVYTLSKVVEVHGQTGIMLMGFDRLNDAANKNGIPHLTVTLDGETIIDITIDKIPFSANRNVLCYRDYALNTMENKSFRKLYIDDGNELNIYKSHKNKGIITIRDTLLHDVKIIAKDAHGNESIVKFQLKGAKPKTAAIKDSNSFKPFRQQVFDNTLVFMGKKAEHNGYFAHVFANRMNYELSTSYYVNDYSVYLWDLRTGIPDSIELCGEIIYPGMEMMVPSNTEFRYYKDEFDLHFYSKTLFDTIYLKTDYMDELVDNREVFEIGEDVYPINRNLKVILKPSLEYKHKNKVAVYYTTDLKNFSYQGGEWKNRQFEFLTRTLGKYTLLPDTIPPEIRVVQQDREHFKCFITDKLSGIKDYEFTVNGVWVLLNYDPKNNYLWSEKLDKYKPFAGTLELKVRDNVNNEKVYQTTIK